MYMIGSRHGQSVFEYLMIFVVLAAITLFSAGFLQRVRATVDGDFQRAVNRMVGR